METWALLPAAGSSSRMGSAIEGSKVLYPLAATGKSSFLASIENFELSGLISGYVVACRELDREEIAAQFASLKTQAPLLIVVGGTTRQESVRNCLNALPDVATHVAVHDAARPFCSIEKIREVIRVAQEHKAAILATPATSTVKLQQKDSNQVAETIDRQLVWLAQTPQVFEKNLLVSADDAANARGFVATDESQLIEAIGHPVVIVEGNPENIKLTTASDLSFANWKCSNQQEK